MRKMVLILGLAVATVLATTSDSFAQRGRWGGRGGWGGGYYGGGYYGGGWGGAWGGGYYPYYSGYYYGAPAYPGGYYYGYYPYYSNYYGIEYPSQYGYQSGYFDPNAGDVSQQQPMQGNDIRQMSFNESSSARVKVTVPNPGAQIWFDDTPTMQRGMERSYFTPPLQQGGTYTVKVRWTDNGRPIEQQRQISVQPGQTATVDFRAESLQTPPSQQQPPMPLPSKQNQNDNK
jgi:uncharacterized protein (TIGR03000 family)